MAVKKVEPVKTAESVKKQQPVYGAAEFAKNSQQMFQVPSECVSAAFKMAGRTEATLDEAKLMVDQFLTGR
jgi:hypothetical protein